MDAKHTPGPWHLCNNGLCSCFTVMSNDHPVAEITHGEWGDTWPELRAKPGSNVGELEAYIAESIYGSVPDDVARANWRLIVAARICWRPVNWRSPQWATSTRPRSFAPPSPRPPPPRPRHDG